MRNAPSMHKEPFNQAWARAENRFVKEFTRDFCHENGDIDWTALLRFNSGGKKPGRSKSCVDSQREEQADGL
ncbi:MAG: hypothetical protein ACFCUX_03550 [Candidatus Methylacidiphilales bacterium]